MVGNNVNRSESCLDQAEMNLLLTSGDDQEKLVWST